jgi:hypothetical protein
MITPLVWNYRIVIIPPKGVFVNAYYSQDIGVFFFHHQNSPKNSIV